jgi:N-glycosylase/DNA lyase
VISETSRTFIVRDYDLGATLNSGQAFRWSFRDQTWVGIIGQHWVRLRADPFSISAETAEPVSDWTWLTGYLDLELDLTTILLSFPDDEPMRAAVSACRGLRLLRQDPWECLASFILSSTKQIVQIRQIISLLAERFGEPVSTPAPFAPAYSFPTASRLARASEAELRACKMGFRAPYLLAVARAIADGSFDPIRWRHLPLDAARHALMKLPGVGRKISDCVLLFAGGFSSAFPIDVWVAKALRQLYFPGRTISLPKLQAFAESYFGPNAGYAQQYLFHYMRLKGRKVERERGGEPESIQEPRQRAVGAEPPSHRVSKRRLRGTSRPHPAAQSSITLR